MGNSKPCADFVEIAVQACLQTDISAKVHRACARQRDEASAESSWARPRPKASRGKRCRAHVEIEGGMQYGIDTDHSYPHGAYKNEKETCHSPERHKLLKDKRDELMRQFLDLARENMALRQKVEAGILAANKNFVIARAGMDEPHSTRH